MPIPPLDPDTGYLEPGDHLATLEEVEHVFGWNHRRRIVLGGLRFVVSRLRASDVQTIWVDGSFTTAKERPSDVDVIYISPPTLDPATLGILSPYRRRELKTLQRVDLWVHPSYQPGKSTGSPVVTLHDWMSTDRDDKPKGMVLLVETG